MPFTGAQDYYSQHMESLVLFAVIAFLLNAFAKSRGFFTLPTRSPRSKLPSISLIPVVTCFAIYLGISVVFAPILASLIKRVYLITRPDPSSLPYLGGWLQFFIVCLNLFFLFLYARSQDRILMKKIWKDYSIPEPASPLKDLLSGVLTWILSFPVVVVIGQLTDMIVFSLFQVETYEQIAVRYLRMALGSPSMLALALFTILIAAPVMEEFLFRGLLQTWLKKYVGTKAAILLAAFCFALFHLAPSQGLGNISLGLPLFFFAFFLGFIYERQASLFAPIGLHITFNAVTTFRILFMPDT